MFEQAIKGKSVLMARKLFDRFAQIMAPDGYLFIGHSESMLDGTDRFEPVGRTIYRLKSN